MVTCGLRLPAQFLAYGLGGGGGNAMQINRNKGYKAMKMIQY